MLVRARRFLGLVGVAAFSTWVGLVGCRSPESPQTSKQIKSGSDAQERVGHRMLFLAAEGFNVQELYGVWVPMKALGYEIEVAAPHAGRVLARPDQPGERDIEAQLSLAEVQPERYGSLFIPGGYSPGHLEKEPEALRIVRAFVAAGKPISAVCHGPRLLMRADVVQGKVLTSLFSLPNEIAEVWKSRPFGFWLDEPVVVDGELLTARYPNDIPEFARVWAARLSHRGGLPVTRAVAPIVIIEESTTSHRRWFYSQLRNLGAEVYTFDLSMDQPRVVQGAVVLLNLNQLTLPEDTPLRTTLARARKILRPEGVVLDLEGVEQISLTATSDAERIYALWTAASAPGDPVPPLADTPKPQVEFANSLGVPFDPHQTYEVVIALRRGFDEVALKDWLRGLEKIGKGSQVLLVGPEKGTLSGMNQGSVEVAASYEDAIQLAPGAWIIAPGGLWPENDPKARQREEAPWLEEQEKLDRAREAWLLQHYERGAVLFLTGFDALRLGRLPSFKGLEFAAPEQTMWSFGKQGGKFHRAGTFLKSAERLFSARADSIDQVIELARQSTSL